MTTDPKQVQPARSRVVAALMIALAGCGLTQAAEFVYQGQLDDRGVPANGRYDLRIAAFGDERSVQALTAPITFRDVEVKDGRFELRFDAALANARETWLEVAVRDAGAREFATIPGRSKAIAAPLIGACWSSTGDAGTTASNFLGTTDAQPLVLRTANVQSLRIEPSAELYGGNPITANVIAGSSGNGVGAGVRGATIAGGGTPSGAVDPYFGSGMPNVVTDVYGSIVGGWGNQAGDASGGPTNAGFATVGGGRGNNASGSASVVAGGAINNATGEHSSIGGGLLGFASGSYAHVGGGDTNVASGTASNIAGGGNNTAAGLRSSVGGGWANIATGDSSTVSGGDANAAAGGYSAVPGGRYNCAGGDRSFAGGYRAKARAAVDPNDGGGCDYLSSYPGGLGDSGSFVWADSQEADFETSGPNQFLLRASGGVGINTNNLPIAVDLALSSRSGNADLWMRPNGASNGINLAAWGDATQAALYIARFDGISYTDYALWQSDGRLRVFFDNPIKPTSGGWAAPSDARLKQDIEPLQHSLDRLLALRGVRYAYRPDAPNGYFTPGTHIGFVAQEVEAVFPGWVSSDIDGYKLVAPQGFEALAVEALRELRDRGLSADAAQAERIAALERENTELRSALATLAQQQANAIAELRADWQSRHAGAPLADSRPTGD